MAYPEDFLDVSRNAMGSATIELCKVAEQIADEQGLTPSELYPFVIAFLTEVFGNDDGPEMAEALGGSLDVI